MQRIHGFGSSVITPVRWAALLLVMAVVGAMAVPAGARSQTPVPAGGGVIDFAPASALFYMHADTRADSPQVQQAAALIERAGFADMLDDSAETDEFTDVEIGVVVASFPETTALDPEDVLAEPLASTELFSVVLDLLADEAVVVLTGDNAAAIHDKALSELEEKLEFSEGELVEREYGGASITSFTPAAAEEWEQPQFVARAGEYVLMGTDDANADALIDTWNGEQPGIATREQYQEISALLPAEHLSLGFIDGPAILDGVEAAYPEVIDAAGSQTTELLNAWTGFSFSAEDAGFLLETRSIAAGDPFDPITPIDGSFFDKVPSDALFATNGANINENGIVTLLAYLFATEFVGEDFAATPVPAMDVAAAQEAVFAEAEQLLGFNLKTDFTDLLTGEFGITLSISDITSETPTVSALIVSEVSDPDRMRDTVSKIAFIAGAGLGDQTAVEERMIDGSTVNVIDISESGVADTAGFGVVDDELVIGVGSGLDDYESGAPAPMSADPAYTAVMAELPGAYGSITYVNMPVALDVVLGITGSLEGSMATEDAHPACAEFDTQADAQAAFDEDQFANFDLDQDFDGEACEDWFAPAAASPVAEEDPYRNVVALAMVTTQEDGVNGTSTFLLIGGE